MIKALHIKSTGEIIKKEYPRKDEKPVKGLNKDLQWLDLAIEPKPDFNPIQFNLDYELNIVDGVCVQSWVLREKPQEEVIKGLNNAVGEWIDGNGNVNEGQYPIWEQNKHSGKALRALNKMLAGGTLTTSEQNYINYVQKCADWAAECRNLRDDYEATYLSEGQLPAVVFPNKPEKTF